jgi:NAD(P)-dependent dehydrogenase (short-subunit alcohol dehydrogenase family)
MARRLAGKVAVVTGGTTGLGQREALCSGRRAEDNAALIFRRAIGKGMRRLMPWLAP